MWNKLDFVLNLPQFFLFFFASHKVNIIYLIDIGFGN